LKIKLFYKPGCPKCPSAKDLLDSIGRPIEEFNIENVDGLAEATYYGIAATPSILILDDNNNEQVVWKGTVPAKEDLIKWL
jgi:glutaredoxin